VARGGAQVARGERIERSPIARMTPSRGGLV
jgi:hypothetical protein